MALSAQDLIGGFDPTNAASINGSDLLALVEAGTPFTDKGLVGYTDDVAGNADVPDATNTTKWQRYIWLRRMVSSVVAYVWDPSSANDVSGVGFQHWVQITVAALADYSVTNVKIAPAAVSDDKIVSMSFSKLTGVPNFMTADNTQAAGGDLTGTYPDPTIAANAVTRTKLSSDAANDAVRAVGSDHIQNLAVDALRHLKLSDAAALQGIRKKADGSNWEYKLWPTLQRSYKNVVHGANPTTTKVWPADNTIPQLNEGDTVVAANFTPLSATSLIRISFDCYLGASAAVAAGIAIFTGASASCLAIGTSYIGSSTQYVGVSFVMASPGTALFAVTIQYAALSAATITMNEPNGGGFFGGTRSSWLVIEEIGNGTIL